MQRVFLRKLTCLRLKNPFLSQLGRYKDRAITREVSFIPWMIPSSFLLHGPYMNKQPRVMTEQQIHWHWHCVLMKCLKLRTERPNYTKLKLVQGRSFPINTNVRYFKKWLWNGIWKKKTVIEYLQIQAHVCQWAEGSSPWGNLYSAACQASSSALYAAHGLFYCSQCLWDGVAL